MRSVRLLASAFVVGVLAGTTGAQAAVPVPRSGCFLVKDAKGDHNAWPTTAPVREQTKDRTFDLAGLNVGVTPTALTVYVSLDKLAERATYGVGQRTQTVITLNGRELVMWVDRFGGLQPARDAMPTADLPSVPPGSPVPLRRFQKSSGAEVRPTTAEWGGAPVVVTSAVDVGRSYVSWTFSRPALEKAFGKKLAKGLPLLIGTTETSNSFAGAFDIVQDEMAGGVYRVGAKGCV